MSYRSKSDDYKQKEQHTPAWVKDKSSKAGSSSPKMISNTSELHTKPTAMMVSPSGERITCALDNSETTQDLIDTNPFSSSNVKNHDSESDDNFIPKLPSKKEKLRKIRRRIPMKDKRKAERIILTQKCETSRNQPKSVSVQTDAIMSLMINFPETIGDGEKHSRSCMELMSLTGLHISSEKPTNKQYLSENLRKFLSFLLMIILIFWLTSIILEVEIPAEFCRIILNYISSYKLGYSYQEKPKTFIDKIWEYINNIFAYFCFKFN